MTSSPPKHFLLNKKLGQYQLSHLMVYQVVKGMHSGKWEGCAMCSGADFIAKNVI